MLKQTFLEAKTLGVTPAQRDAAAELLRMLEAGEIGYYPAPHCQQDYYEYRAAGSPDSLDMSVHCCHYDCGTVACVSGWVGELCGHALLSELTGTHLVGRLPSQNDQIVALCCPDDYMDGFNFPPARVARALRAWLETGVPDWSE